MPARVTRVVDGDTIEVESSNRAYRVRYIGIDAPELGRLAHQPGEWLAREATEANRGLVEGQMVYLERDVSETDRYGRLLRYVYLEDGTLVNAELVCQGYALALTYPPDVKHQGALLEMQREAHATERGLWAASPQSTEPE